MIIHSGILSNCSTWKWQRLIVIGCVLGHPEMPSLYQASQRMTVNLLPSVLFPLCFGRILKSTSSDQWMQSSFFGSIEVLLRRYILWGQFLQMKSQDFAWVNQFWFCRFQSLNCFLVSCCVNVKKPFYFFFANIVLAKRTQVCRSFGAEIFAPPKSVRGDSHRVCWRFIRWLIVHRITFSA